MLDLSPANPKALYRRGQALYHLRDYDNALLSLKKAKESAKSGKRKYDKQWPMGKKHDGCKQLPIWDKNVM